MKSQLLASVALAGCISFAACSGQAPPTIEDALRLEGVSLSNQALLAALGHSKAEVRGMAAVLLAQHMYQSAIPALNLALQNEQDPAARLDLAVALDEFGQASGLSAFADLCNDRKLPPDLRLNAAGHSLTHGGSICAAAATGLLSTSVNPAIQQAALYYLLDMRLPAPAINSDSAGLEMGVHRALDNELAYLRRASAECVGKFRIASERSHLLTVMQSEPDPDVKTAMQKSLTDLSR